MDTLGKAGDRRRQPVRISRHIGRCYVAAAEVEIVVLELRGPTRRQRVLNAAAGRPTRRIEAAAAVEGGRREPGAEVILVERNVGRAVRPGGTAFGIEQSAAGGIAQATSQRGVEIRTNPAVAADDSTG